MNSQSAFSLIEVLVALLILSAGVMGAGTLLLNSTQSVALAVQREHGITIAWAVANALSMDHEGRGLAAIRQDGQDRLDQSLPGSILSIHYEMIEKRCLYTVALRFSSPNLKPIEFTLRL